MPGSTVLILRGQIKFKGSDPRQQALYFHPLHLASANGLLEPRPPDDLAFPSMLPPQNPSKKGLGNRRSARYETYLTMYFWML